MSLQLRLPLLAILLAGAALCGITSRSASAASTGLVAAYAFDESSGTTAADLSGNGNDASLLGAVFATGGKYAGAVSLDGASARVNVPDAPELDLTSGMTLEAWVRPTGFSSAQAVIAKERAGGGFPYGLELDNGTPSAYGNGLAGAAGTSALPLSTWSFVAATFDGSTLRVYVNGTQVASAAQSSSLTQSNGQLSIGGDAAWGEWFAGKIDNVRIYNRALGATELQSDQTTAVATAAPPPSAPAPVAAFAFDEGSGSTAADTSGNGNNAALSYTAWTAAGKWSTAAVFDGSRSLVTVPDSGSLDATAGLTLEAWVKPTAFSTAQTLVAKERPGGGFPWGLELDNGIPTAYVTAATNATARGTAALPTGSWSFVAATYDGTTLRVYVNGAAVGSAGATGILATSNGTLSIGGDAAWGENFNGAIDNVRVYATALTAAQLTADMNAAVPGVTAPPPPPDPPAGDTTAPTVPTGLAANGVGQTGLALSWAASTDVVGVAGYRVYVNGAQTGTATGTSLAVGNLACGTSYTLGVEAYDAAGNASARATIAVSTSACSGGSPGGSSQCAGRSFYVDYAGGSDGSSGTSTSAPWKRAPGMAGFSGSYSHQAHDCFYFKGGVTWPNAVFPLKVPGGGDASADTYYGADPGWYAGPSWSQPVFDLQSQFVSGSYNTVVDFRSGDRTTLDNIEVANWKTRGWGGGYSTCSAFWVQGVHHVTLQRVYFHDWNAAGGDTNCVAVQADTYGAYGGQTRILDSRFLGNGAGEFTKCINVVKNTEMAFAEGFIFPCVGSQGDGSGAVGEIAGNLLHDCGYPSWPSPNSNVHGDVIQADKNNSGGDTSAGTLSIHDNVIYNTGRDSTNECESMLIGNPGETDYVWNNVIYNLQGNAVSFPQDAGYARGVGMYVWNNTLVGGGTAGSFSYAGQCVRGSGSWSTVAIQNNHCVTNGAGFGGPSGAVVDHNVVRTRAQADGDGTSLTGEYAFAPTGSAPIVGAGANLASNCSGPLAGLCSDTSYAGDRLAKLRPASGAWDVGAYQYR